MPALKGTDVRPIYLNPDDSRTLIAHGFKMTYTQSIRTRGTAAGIVVESLSTAHPFCELIYIVRNANLTWWPQRSDPYTVLTDLIRWIHLQQSKSDDIINKNYGIFPDKGINK